MTREELENKIANYKANADVHAGTENFLYGIEVGKLQVYEEWLKDLIKEDNRNVLREDET